MSESDTRSAIAGQLGGAMDMLENAIRACPDSLWGDTTRNPQFWYLAYHAIFYNDVYLSPGDKSFAPPKPYTLSEFDPSGLMPDRVFTKDEMISYLDHGRRKLKGLLAELTEERAGERLEFGSVQGSRLEVLLYNLRHIQHHSAQLNLLLRQATDSAPKWVVRAKP
ncbi:MAG TPA: DinB family protein [Planctomycetota bacterium]|nr:DinB family protein [Planctomycetota bacterium]